MEFLKAAFGVEGHVTLAQECARAVLIFLYGWFALRAIGRRVFARWAALDIIVSLLVGSNLSRALTGNAPLSGTLAATTLILVMHWVLAQAAARSRIISKIVEGRPIRLVADGEADYAALRRWSISDFDLQEALRLRALNGLDEVREGVLEPSGKINLVG